MHGERASIFKLYASRRSAFLHQLVASVGDRVQWEGQVTGKQMEYFCRSPGAPYNEDGCIFCHDVFSFFVPCHGELVKQFCTDMSASGTDSGAVYYQLEVECISSFWQISASMQVCRVALLATDAHQSHLITVFVIFEEKYTGAP